MQDTHTDVDQHLTTGQPELPPMPVIESLAADLGCESQRPASFSVSTVSVPRAPLDYATLAAGYPARLQASHGASHDPKYPHLSVVQIVKERGAGKAGAEKSIIPHKGIGSTELATFSARLQLLARLPRYFVE